MSLIDDIGSYEDSLTLHHRQSSNPYEGMMMMRRRRSGSFTLSDNQHGLKLAGVKLAHVTDFY